MKLFLIASLVLLSCLGRSLSEHRNNNNHLDQQIEINQSGRSGVRINLLDLNDDVLQLIFDQMAFIDLLNVKSVHPYLAAHAKSALHQQYRDYKIVISGRVPNEPLYLELSEEKIVLVHDFELAVYLLKHHIGEDLETGHNLQVLSNYLRNDTESNIINRLVNQCGAKSIKKLNLDKIMKSTILAQYTHPMEAVEEFSCHFYKLPDPREVLSLDVLFPNLRKLSLTIQTISAMGLSFLDCKMTHLEHLYVYPINSRWNNSNVHMKGLLQKNLHIKSFEFINFPPEYRNILREMRLNLEKLTIHELGIGNETICFENVEDFEYSPFRDSNFLDQATFPRIESIKIMKSSSFHDQWREFLHKHGQLLKQATFEEYFTLDPSLFMEILDEMPNLEELYVTCANQLSAQTIAKIIQSHDKMLRFDFVVTALKLGNNADELEAIRQEFDSLRDQFEDVDVLINIKNYGNKFVFTYEKKTI